MLSKPVLREIIRMAICTAILCVIMLAVFAVTGNFNLPSLYGAILGYFVNILNFTVMSIVLERSLSKSGARAGSAVGLNYFLRLAVIAAAIYWAIKAPYFNYVAAVIPLLFTRISVYILNFLDVKR